MHPGFVVGGVAGEEDAVLGIEEGYAAGGVAGDVEDFEGDAASEVEEVAVL